MPALFGAPKDDTFVSPQHTKDLYMAYNGSKQLLTFEGDHNSQRSIEWIMCVLEFLKAHLLEADIPQQNLCSSLPPAMPNGKEFYEMIKMSETNTPNYNNYQAKERMIEKAI